MANFDLPTSRHPPPLGITLLEFTKIIGVRKLESLGYHVVLFA